MEIRANLKARVCGGRIGTVYVTAAELRGLFGEPGEGVDEKTTMEWVLETPAGVIGIWDYWWNLPGEWSVGGLSREAAALVVEFLSAKLGRDVTAVPEREAA